MGQKLSMILDKAFFFLAFAVAVPVAAAFPNIACTGGLIKPEITIFWCVIIGIFFVEGLSLPTTEMIVALPRFKFHAATQIYNLVFVPCVIFLVCKLMSNNSPLSALHDGFFALAAVPTTTSMCVMLTGKAGGNKALAAINAVLGNILAILVTPLLLGIFTTVDPELSHGALVLGLCFKMLVPLSLGQIARARLGPSLEQHMTKVTRCQQCLLVLLLFQILSDLFKSSGAVSGAIFMQTLGIIFALHIFFVATAWVLSACGKIDVVDRIAFVFAASQKTVVLGVPMLHVVYANRLQDSMAILLLPLILYHLLELIIGLISSGKIKSWVDKQHGHSTITLNAADDLESISKSETEMLVVDSGNLSEI